MLTVSNFTHTEMVKSVKFVPPVKPIESLVPSKLTPLRDAPPLQLGVGRNVRVAVGVIVGVAVSVTVGVTVGEPVGVVVAVLVSV